MNDKNIYIDTFLTGEAEFFRTGKIAWKRTEEDVWAELQRKLSTRTETKPVIRLAVIVRWSAAALLFFLVALAATVQFYTQTIKTVPGEHLMAQLPDGSTVDLNAASTLSYRPLKWRFERTLKFEGEAYFNVKKGKQFSVESKLGTTRVLGTSFNIYARNQNYRVTCLTGKVQVNSGEKEQVLLTPNNHAELENGKLVVKEMFGVEKAISWKNNEFFFVNRPLKEVIDEIERQYAVTIRLAPELNNRNFGSNFSKKHSVEEVLEFVCKPMNLMFVRESDNVFLIVEKS